MEAGSPPAPDLTCSCGGRGRGPAARRPSSPDPHLSRFLGRRPWCRRLLEDGHGEKRQPMRWGVTRKVIRSPSAASCERDLDFGRKKHISDESRPFRLGPVEMFIGQKIRPDLKFWPGPVSGPVSVAHPVV